MTTTQTAPRWRRLEPDERRAQILERAIELFGERPYAEVSTGDVARAAGVARGLINHYFGSKRGLYLEAVQQIITVPTTDPANVPAGPLRERVEFCVDWLLASVSAHARGWIAVVGAEGVGSDPEVERLIADADERAAENLLKTVGMHEAEPKAEIRAMVRTFGGMAKAAVREWMINETLTREQALLLLTEQLTTLLTDTVPRLQSLAD